MQDKQKVTLYLSPKLHRQLKIRAAVDSEPMSAIAQKAIIFYLQNPELVEGVQEAYGKTHQVYHCPECEHPVVVKDRELLSLANQPSVLVDGELPVPKVTTDVEQQEVEKLVRC